MRNDYPHYDEQAKRFYRWETYGGAKIKAFAPDMLYAGGTPAPEKPKPQPKNTVCPFNRFRTKCREHCALFENGRCMIAKEPAGIATTGKTCPFGGYTCGTGCELYNSGCTLIAYLERKGSQNV